jgi:hypothetical protein
VRAIVALIVLPCERRGDGRIGIAGVRAPALPLLATVAILAFAPERAATERWQSG